MEAALKNLSSTVELLAVAARSGDVRLWDRQYLTRAFHWACYCEHLFSKFHQNPKIRGLMEIQVQHANSNLRAVYGDYTDLSFLDLSQCQHLLLTALLKNPNLPISIMKILFDTTKPAHCKPGEYQEVTGICGNIVQCKSAIQILSPITGHTSAGAEAQAALLTERLHALLSPGGETRRAQQFLDSVLQGCKEAEHLCLVLTAVLLTGENAHARSASVDFLLDWLQQKHSLLQHMCLTLPTSRLKDLAKENVKFRDMYGGVLKKWAADMEYCLDDGKWVQSGTRPKVSFQGVVEHFVVLFEGCPTLWTTVERELTDLKISDGDFDVRGLSVWGDLLAEIQKRLDK
ncbi:Fanconi anemia group F protein [Corythoichthys intestinalis]|uniref:Fanconi anemia group F protein n=1 Tax=Corythoichthys intestinalis TaxID=161448 RepID=UPI0025A581CF|nr:Fanconi anemia group F protein [Corythoichthys intestinalis]XP_061812903.1 Fanconi anemia group F protein [Nerophis lumbriciformis]